MSGEFLRVVPEYLGEHFCFEPADLCEKVTEDGEPVVLYFGDWPTFVTSDTGEVCFGTSIPGILLAIAARLTPGRYHVYATQESPDVDLSKSSSGDFSVSGEVRYRRPVDTVYHGYVDVSQGLANTLRSIQQECVIDPSTAVWFDCETALERLLALSPEILFVPAKQGKGLEVLA